MGRIGDQDEGDEGDEERETPNPKILACGG